MGEHTTLDPVVEPARTVTVERALGPIVPLSAPPRPPLVAPSMPSMAPRVARSVTAAGPRPSGPLPADLPARAPNHVGRAQREQSVRPAPYGRTKEVLAADELRRRRQGRIRIACGAVLLSLGAIFGPMLVHHWFDEAPTPVETPVAARPGH